MPVRRCTIRLKPTPTQERLFWQYVGATRHVWNWALAKINERRAAGLKDDWGLLHREYAEYRQETAWLSEMNSHTVRSVLRDLKTAKAAFFSRCKKRQRRGKKNPYGYPQFKAKFRSAARFWIPERVKIDENRLCVWKQRIRMMRLLPEGEVGKSVRIKCAGGKWYASFTITTPDPPIASVAPDNLVGIDIGLKTWAVISDGTTIANPRFLRRTERKLRHAQRKLSRQVKGSERWKRQKGRISRLYAQVANRRKHWSHLHSRRIADLYDAVCIESHSLLGQAQSPLAKSVHDAGHGAFRSFLKYKLPDRGKQCVEAEPFFPSSKTCSQCGHVFQGLTKRHRKWTCEACGVTHDRDLNAARNLETYGRTCVAHDGLKETANSQV